MTSESVTFQLDGNAIKPQFVSYARKGSIGEAGKEIESFKKNKVQAITLELGKKEYYLNQAIEIYLTNLTPLPFFKYVLFLNKSGEFSGIISGVKLLHKMQNSNIDLVKLIESGDVSTIKDISMISVPKGSNKQKALQLMHNYSLSELPVIDEFNSFIRVVEKKKIISSIVDQIVLSLNKEKR